LSPDSGKLKSTPLSRKDKRGFDNISGGFYDRNYDKKDLFKTQYGTLKWYCYPKVTNGYYFK